MRESVLIQWLSFPHALKTMRDLYESSAAVQSLRDQYDWSAIMTGTLAAIPAASGAFTLLPITMASMKFPVCARSRSCVESNWVAAPLLGVSVYPSRLRSSVPSVPSKKTEGRGLRMERTDDSKLRFQFL